MTEQRRTFILRKGLWQPIALADVKRGDRLRLFEPDGTPITGAHGETEWQALADARPYALSVGVYAEALPPPDPGAPASAPDDPEPLPPTDLPGGHPCS